eukprot:TRINITY_DN2395_c0_g4_i2.p1 TRINITY_DN2395_c0_g4~~TRINITY_DN2395_c0_g4_i2.p1  ORF type:complete len:201 (-),score=20.82 TRINITY_DN2395_c0_g4_i2:32-544(-)
MSDNNTNNNNNNNQSYFPNNSPRLGHNTNEPHFESTQGSPSLWKKPQGGSGATTDTHPNSLTAKSKGEEGGRGLAPSGSFGGGSGAGRSGGVGGGLSRKATGDSVRPAAVGAKRILEDMGLHGLKFRAEDFANVAWDTVHGDNPFDEGWESYSDLDVVGATDCHGSGSGA